MNDLKMWNNLETKLNVQLIFVWTKKVEFLVRILCTTADKKLNKRRRLPVHRRVNSHFLMLLWCLSRNLCPGIVALANVETKLFELHVRRAYCATLQCACYVIHTKANVSLNRKAHTCAASTCHPGRSTWRTWRSGWLSNGRNSLARFVDACKRGSAIDRPSVMSRRCLSSNVLDHFLSSSRPSVCSHNFRLCQQKNFFRSEETVIKNCWSCAKIRPD